MTVLIPPVQLALWLAAQQAAARRFDSGRRWFALRVLGAGMIGVAAVGGVDALRRFVVRGTTWHPWDIDGATRLVTEGPNAFSRNPMYAGMALGLAGTGLLTGRAWPALAVAGFVAGVTPQVRREEAALARIFGAQWHAYAARVPRWA